MLRLLLALTLLGAASAQTPKPNPMIDCLEVKSYSEFVSAVNGASAGTRLSFCPFELKHDDDTELATISASGVMIFCDKKVNGEGNTSEWQHPTMVMGVSSGRRLSTQYVEPKDDPACMITGEASNHLSIQADHVSLFGLSFEGATAGAVQVGAVSSTNLLHLSFVNNIRPSGDGGALVIHEQASLTHVIHCEFVDNETKNGNGGAIASMSELTTYRSHFVSNHAQLSGGAIHKAQASVPVNLSRSHFNDNTIGTGSGPAINAMPSGNYCDAGENVACANIDLEDGKRCDGVFADACDLFDGACPTPAPTTSPTAGPTKKPTASPTKAPTKTPTEGPTKSPTKNPTKAPTTSPTAKPSVSMMPSCMPSRSPSPSITIPVPAVKEPSLSTKAPHYNSHSGSKKHTHNSTFSANKGKFHNHTHNSHLSHKYGHTKHSGSNHTHTNHTHWSKHQHEHSYSSNSNHTHNHTHFSKLASSKKHTHTHHSKSDHKSKTHTHNSAVNPVPVAPPSSPLSPPSPTLPTSPVDNSADPPSDGDLSNDYRRRNRHLGQKHGEDSKSKNNHYGSKIDINKQNVGTRCAGVHISGASHKQPKVPSTKAPSGSRQLNEYDEEVGAVHTLRRRKLSW